MRYFGIAVLLTARTMSADVAYQQEFRSSTPLNMNVTDQQYEIYIKGNKLARWGKVFSHIFDLDAGTITTINNTKQTYSVTNFEKMDLTLAQYGNSEFEVKVDQTGQTKLVSGEKTSETIVTLKATQMTLTMHAWLVAATPAMKEAQSIEGKIAARYSSAFSGIGLGFVTRGMNEAMKELAKQDGYVVETQTSISGMRALSTLPAGERRVPTLFIESDKGHFTRGNVDDNRFTIPPGFTEEKRSIGGVYPIPPDIGPDALNVGSEVSSPPHLQSKVEPVYSEQARQEHITGSVRLSVIIDEDGIPTNISVTRPLGYGLDEKAVEAVQQWRFRPGIRNGMPVKVRASVEVNFNLLDTPR